MKHVVEMTLEELAQENKKISFEIKQRESRKAEISNEVTRRSYEAARAAEAKAVLDRLNVALANMDERERQNFRDSLAKPT